MRSKSVALVAAACAVAACTPQFHPDNTQTATNDVAATGIKLPVGSDTTPPSEPYSPELQRMLDRAAFAEEPGRPCLMREIAEAPWVDDPAVRTRIREVRSDSWWLGRWTRENLSDRLAFAEVGYDYSPRAGEPMPATPPPLIYEIAVTGAAPINPPKLGDRAANVPVVVRYDAPVSFEEFMERRRQGTPSAQNLLPTLLGEGGSPGGPWAVQLSISRGDEPEVLEAALSHCDALRRAYRLPVLIEPLAGEFYTTLDAARD